MLVHRHRIGEIDPVFDSLGEVAPHLQGTTDGLELLERLDILERGVVGNQETSTNNCQGGEIDLTKFGVSDEGDIAVLSVGKVGGGKLLEVVEVETSRAVDSGEPGHIQGGHVGDFHVGSPLQVRHRESHILVICRDLEGLGNGANGSGEIAQAAVVVDIKGPDLLHVDTSQTGQEGIGDGNRLGFGDTRGPDRKGGQRRQGLEKNRVDSAQGRKSEAREKGEVLEMEGALDGCKIGAGEGQDGRVV